MNLEADFKKNHEKKPQEENLLTCAQEKDPPIKKQFKFFLLKFSSKNTRISYEKSFEDFLVYWKSVGHSVSDIKEIQRSHLDIWNRVLESKYTPASVAAKLSVVLSLLRFCHENGWTDENIGERVHLPRINRSKGKTEAFSESELKIILEKLRGNFEKAHEPYIQASHARAWVRYVVFLTMTTVGMRVSEVVNLKIEDLDTTGEFPRLRMVLKGGEEHTPLIPDELSILLKAYCHRFHKWGKKNDPMFVLSPKSNKPLNREYVTRMISEIAQECGISKRVSSHSCRATVASLLHKSAVPVGEIKELLGHKSLMTTMMYVRKTDEEKESAARKNPIFKMMGE